jgi:hypothetical protein
LGYYAASTGNFLPTFQDSLSVPSPRFKNPRTESVVGENSRGCYLTKWLYVSMWLLCTLQYTLGIVCGWRQLSRYSDSLRAGRSGNQIPVGARFSVSETLPGVHPQWVLVSFPGVKRPCRGAEPHLAPTLKKEYIHISTPPLGLRGLLYGDPVTFTFTGGIYT